MKVFIYTPLRHNRIAMSFGLGTYIETMKKALGYVGIEYVDGTKDFKKSDAQKCDIVHIHDPLYRFNFNLLYDKIGIRKDAKIVSHLHTPVIPHDLENIEKMSDVVIYVSKIQMKTFGGSGLVVYNAVTPEPKEQWNSRPISFIMNSRIDYAKGFDWFYKQALLMPQFKFATTGELKVEFVLDKLGRVPTNVVDHGYVPRAELRKLWASSEIHLLPSYFETFGLTTLEAMLQGTAPAVSIYSGVSEILPDNLSIKFDPYTHDIAYIYDNYLKKRLFKKRQEFREFALKNDYRRLGNDLLKIYEKL